MVSFAFKLPVSSVKRENYTDLHLRIVLFDCSDCRDKVCIASDQKNLFNIFCQAIGVERNIDIGCFFLMAGKFIFTLGAAGIFFLKFALNYGNIKGFTGFNKNGMFCYRTWSPMG